MQNKKSWTFIAAGICGVGSAAYYYFGQGRGISLAIASGALMGALSYLCICFLYGRVAGAGEFVSRKDILPENEKQAATALDKFIEKKESAERNTVQKSIPSKDATRLQETFEIPGAYYHRTSIAKVANPNPDWKKTCKSLIKAGKANQKIYRFERTTKTAELVEEPGNSHDPNAVMVTVEGEKVGYISADEALHVKEIMRQHCLKSVTAVITGGEYKTITPDAEMIKNQSGPFVTVKICYR